jgi:type VI secretion system secreted protein VgrG
MSATNLLDIAARSADQIASAGATLLGDVRYRFEAEGSSGPAAWRVSAVEVSEELSGDYTGTVSLENDDPAADERELRGASASLSIERPGRGTRRFSGIVTTVVSEGIAASGVRRARAVLVPAFKCLDQAVDWRKFVNMTVPDILRAVLGAGLQPFGRSAKLSLSREDDGAVSPFPVREYTAQRAESGYAFVRRLCSEEGLATWYDNSGDLEILMISDDNSRFARLDAAVPLVSTDGTDNAHTFESIRTFEVASSAAPAAATVDRFDLTRPAVPLAQRAHLDSAGPAAEVYDPTGAVTLHQFQGDRYTGEDTRLQARLRLEAARVTAEVGTGEGNIIAFQPGMVFQLASGSGHPSPLEGQHLLTGVRHVGRPGRRGDGGAVVASTYHNSFSTIPASVPFRPARIARPIATLDYATVEAVSDDDPIHHDVHGRVKVRFWWDRMPGDPAGDSGWIPVAVPWAGQGRGMQVVPRQGDVVTVAFELGDPDRPVVVGSVNTGTNRMLFDLPNKTVIALKTQSQRPDGHGGFTTVNFNELLLDDAAFKERFLIYAGKDYIRTVLNDETTQIDHDEHRTVGNDRSVEIEGNDSLEVEGNLTVTVDANDTLTVQGSRTETVSGSETISVGSQTVSVGGSQTNTVTGPRVTTVIGPDTNILTSRGTNISGSDGTHVVGDATLTVDGKATVNQGGTTIELDSGTVDIRPASWIRIKRGGTEIIVDGGDNVSITSSARVKVDTTGDLILKGKTITLTGQTEVTMQVGSNKVTADTSGVTVKGAKVTESADGEFDITGHPTKVN